MAWFGKYDPTIQQDMRQQLAWAILHPNYDFQSILNVKTPNEDIVRYFEFLGDAISTL